MLIWISIIVAISLLLWPLDALVFGPSRATGRAWGGLVAMLALGAALAVLYHLAGFSFG